MGEENKIFRNILFILYSNVSAVSLWKNELKGIEFAFWFFFSNIFHPFHHKICFYMHKCAGEAEYAYTLDNTRFYDKLSMLTENIK
jgi:hypothetical protein